MKWEQIEQVNKEMATTDIKGKDYVEVNQRVLAFRKCCAGGTISTEIVSLENGVVVIKATILDERDKYFLLDTPMRKRIQHLSTRLVILRIVRHRP